MALNIYDSEQHVFFASKPTIYYGWQFSFSGEFEDAHYFSSKEKKGKYLAKARQILEDKGVKLDEQDSEDVAALAVLNNDDPFPLRNLAERTGTDYAVLSELVPELSNIASKIEQAD